jgi:hypothetical protein
MAAALRRWREGVLLSVHIVVLLSLCVYSRYTAAALAGGPPLVEALAGLLVLVQPTFCSVGAAQRSASGRAGLGWGGLGWAGVGFDKRDRWGGVGCEARTCTVRYSANKSSRET